MAQRRDSDEKKTAGFLFWFCFNRVGTVLWGPPIQAQPYPAHTIQVVIPGAPGDALDLAGRVAVEELEKILKVPVVVINKPGGGASVGTDFVAKAKKDGYTLLYSNSSGLVYNPAFSPEVTPYQTLRDLAPLARSSSLANRITS